MDFSATAVDVMRSNPVFVSNEKLGRINGGLWDLASSPPPSLDTSGTSWDEEGAALPLGVAAGSVDIAILVFTFSALVPTQWAQAVRNVWRCLKPGGEVLFRDYGRGDLAQVRFKKGRWLGENWYVRGDGTRVYFFEEEELRRIWGGGGVGGLAADKEAEEDEGPREEAASEGNDVSTSPWPRFEIVNISVDRRMLVNRQRRLKMYRCWLQGRFRKPVEAKDGVESCL